MYSCCDNKGKQPKKKASTRNLVPLLRTRRWSETIAAAVLFDVLRNVFPGQLAAARSVVGTLDVQPVGTGDAAAEKANL